jgi:LemA protein
LDSTVLTIVVIVAVAGIIVIGYVVALYNSLVQVRNNVGKAWKNIDVLLQQRHDEISKLVEAVRGYAKHEREVLESLTRLRTGYQEAKSIDDKVGIENQINQGLGRLRLAWEGYPDLKASQNFLGLQQRISALESAIADRRELFNDSVNIFNIQIERFPALLMARRLGYGRQQFLEVPEEAKKDVKVQLA